VKGRFREGPRNVRAGHERAGSRPPDFKKKEARKNNEKKIIGRGKKTENEPGRFGSTETEREGEHRGQRTTQNYRKKIRDSQEKEEGRGKEEKRPISRLTLEKKQGIQGEKGIHAKNED